ALSAGRTRFVVMMRGIVEFGGQLALDANLISFRLQFRAVRLVAIRAGDACGKHSALTEGAVFVIFLSDLAVREVDTGHEQAWNGTVEQWSPVAVGRWAARCADARLHARAEGLPCLAVIS